MSAPSDAEVIEELQETATLAVLEVKALQEKLDDLRSRNRALLQDRTADRHIIKELVSDACTASAEHAALVAKCHEAHDAHMEAGELRQLVASVYWVAVETIPHRYEGLCPDGVDGWHRRDPKCPACDVLSRADRVIGGAA